MALQHPLSILLVEDDENSCEIICSILAIKFPQAQILSTGDWNTGLNSFRKDLPDIVISDCNLSEMGEAQILDNIRAIKPSTRVIYLTSRCNKVFIERIAVSGVAVELVPKPIDFEILLTSIKRCIASLSRAN